MHGVDRVEHLAQESFLRAAHGDDDAELGGPGIASCSRRVDDLVEVQERVHVDAGVEPGRLRAERTVLGAGARLGVDEALELDLGSAVREPDAVRERDEVRQLVERQRRQARQFVARQWTPLLEESAGSDSERHAVPPESVSGTRGA